MLLLFVLPMPFVFGAVAFWALRSGGLRRLWLQCGFFVVFLSLFATVAARWNSTVSGRQVATFLALFTGPSLFLVNALLSVVASLTESMKARFAAAFIGSILGLIAGYTLIMFHAYGTAAR